MRDRWYTEGWKGPRKVSDGTRIDMTPHTVPDVEKFVVAGARRHIGEGDVVSWERGYMTFLCDLFDEWKDATIQRVEGETIHRDTLNSGWRYLYRVSKREKYSYYLTKQPLFEQPPLFVHWEDQSDLEYEQLAAKKEEEEVQRQRRWRFGV